MIRCLLCTVGFVYIKSKEALPNDVFKDLVEMCCGIQNPAPTKHHFDRISAIGTSFSFQLLILISRFSSLFLFIVGGFKTWFLIVDN
jgi:hypothetical protein